MPCMPVDTAEQVVQRGASQAVGVELRGTIGGAQTVETGQVETDHVQRKIQSIVIGKS